MGIFYSLFAITEVAFHIYRRKKFSLKNPQLTMTRDDFRKNCEAGQELVILDDLVLDVGDFARYHPGGYFSIHQNRSRDVSKFFYGGY